MFLKKLCIGFTVEVADGTLFSWVYEFQNIVSGEAGTTHGWELVQQIPSGH